jgi:HEAT repeat protein
MRLTKQTVLVAAFAAVAISGCSSSSVPESIRRKAKESVNTYIEKPLAPTRPTPAEAMKMPKQFQVLSQEDWTMRQTASYALGRIGPTAVPSLVQLMRSPDPNMRRQAAETLARIGPDAGKAVPDLTYALNDPDPLVRKSAARALGQIGPAAAESVPALIRVVQEQGP